MIWRENKSRQLPGIEPRAISWLEGPQLAWRSSAGLKALNLLEGLQLAWRSSAGLKVVNLLEGHQLAWRSSVGLRSSTGLKVLSWLEVLNWLEGPQQAWRSSTCLKGLSWLEGPQLAWRVSAGFSFQCSTTIMQPPVLTIPHIYYTDPLCRMCFSLINCACSTM